MKILGCLNSGQLGAQLLHWTEYLPRGCTWPVEGTLGRFKDKSLLFDLRLLTPELGRFSITSWAADLGFLEGASDGAAMALDSSLGELEVFEEECLR